MCITLYVNMALYFMNNIACKISTLICVGAAHNTTTIRQGDENLLTITMLAQLVSILCAQFAVVQIIRQTAIVRILLKRNSWK